MSAVLQTIGGIFDGRPGRPADASTTVAQMGMWERAALGLHSPIKDDAEGYVKFKMGKRSRWLWVRLNGSDRYDLRITRWSAKDLGHHPEWGVDDVYADNLRSVLTDLRDRY